MPAASLVNGRRERLIRSSLRFCETTIMRGKGEIKGEGTTPYNRRVIAEGGAMPHIVHIKQKKLGRKRKEERPRQA